MHEIMGNMLGSLCACPRGLLRRRWWKIGVTMRNCFVWSNSPNFLGSTLYISFLLIIPHFVLFVFGLKIIIFVHRYELNFPPCFLTQKIRFTAYLHPLWRLCSGIDHLTVNSPLLKFQPCGKSGFGETRDI